MMTDNCEDDVVGTRWIAIRPRATVIRISPDSIAISFPSHAVTFTGVDVVRGVAGIIRLLTGPRLDHEVIEEVSSSASLSREFVTYLLDSLASNGCLFHPKAGAPADDGWARFYAGGGADPEEIRVRLRSKTVIAVSGEEHSSELQRLMRESRMNTVPFVVSDSNCTNVSEFLVAVCGEHEKPVIACWGFPYALPLAREVNRSSIAANVPVVFGVCDGFIGRVGPTVIPRSSPCLECMNSRLAANGAIDPDLIDAPSNASLELFGGPADSHPVFAAQVMSAFVLELARFLANSPSRTIGGVLDCSFSEGTCVRRTLLKAPRCTACRRVQPERLAWDAIHPELNVLDEDSEKRAP